MNVITIKFDHTQQSQLDGIRNINNIYDLFSDHGCTHLLFKNMGEVEEHIRTHDVIYLNKSYWDVNEDIKQVLENNFICEVEQR